MSERIACERVKFGQGEFGAGDELLDVRVEAVEGELERAKSGGVSGEDRGEAGAQQAIVGSGEEERGARAEIGDAVAMASRHALDHAVQAQAA